MAILLQGALPAEFAQLPRLLRLSLKNNSVSGSFTTFQQALAKPSLLLQLDLSSNTDIEGVFHSDAFLRTNILKDLEGLDEQPEELKGLVRVLDLRGLGLTGDITPAFVEVRCHTSSGIPSAL
jgi:hypothetical protein